MPLRQLCLHEYLLNVSTRPQQPFHNANTFACHCVCECLAAPYLGSMFDKQIDHIGRLSSAFCSLGKERDWLYGSPCSDPHCSPGGISQAEHAMVQCSGAVFEIWALIFTVSFHMKESIIINKSAQDSRQNLETCWEPGERVSPVAVMCLTYLAIWF